MTKDDDQILDLLRAAAPARADDASERAARERVRRRAAARLSEADRRRSVPARVAVALGTAVLAAVLITAILLPGGGGFGGGPEPALAIDRGPDSVTLTITDQTATAEEMNRELEDAGIDRVRVLSVPGPPNRAGTWAGDIQLAADCKRGPTRFGFGLVIPNQAPGWDFGSDFVNLTFPNRSGKVFIGVSGSGGGKRAVVSTRTLNDPNYALAVLIAIRPRTGAEAADAKDFGSQQLLELGGVFAPYGDALADGRGTCAELDLGPLPPAPPLPSGRDLPEPPRDRPPPIQVQ